MPPDFASNGRTFADSRFTLAIQQEQTNGGPAAIAFFLPK